VDIPRYEMLAPGTNLLIEMIDQRPPVEHIGICCSLQLVISVICDTKTRCCSTRPSYVA
jgi:hypothetical protein